MLNPCFTDALMKILSLLMCFFAFQVHAQRDSHSTSDRRGLIENTDHGSEVPLGVDLMAGDNKGITIYPNPTNDHLLISIAGKPGELRHINMVNLSGQSIIRMKNRRENTFLVDVSEVKNGIYSIEVISGRNIYRKKWAKR